MADLERFPAHDHIHAVNAVHMGQVDQQEAVAADKALPRQGRFGAFHGLVLAVFPAGGVVDAVVPLDLHIADITGREAHKAGVRADEHVGGHHVLQPGQHLGEFQRKLRVGHRLDDEIRGGNLITLDGVLAHGGDKDEDHLFVLFPQQPGRVHAVEHGHHDVHVHDVERGVFFQKSNGFIED